MNEASNIYTWVLFSMDLIVFLNSICKRNRALVFLPFVPYTRDNKQFSLCLLMMLAAPPASPADSVCSVWSYRKNTLLITFAKAISPDFPHLNLS